MKLLRRNYIGCEGRTNGQTDIYYIPPLSSGVITVSAVANSMYTGSFFWRGGGGFMKKGQ
jgi:hypothetical protein